MVESQLVSPRDISDVRKAPYYNAAQGFGADTPGPTGIRDGDKTGKGWLQKREWILFVWGCDHFWDALDSGNDSLLWWIAQAAWAYVIDDVQRTVGCESCLASPEHIVMSKRIVRARWHVSNTVPEVSVETAMEDGLPVWPR